MKLKVKIAIVAILVIAVAVAFWTLIRGNSFDVLQPAGTIADQQKDLLVFTLLLSLVVIIPVFAMTFWITWKYRVSHPKPGAYRPKWHSSKIAESIWWGIPILLILIIGIVTWISSHQLDPYRKLESTKTPIKVQVIALDWKWLFIYPEQGVASVNFLQIPTDRPIDFQLTSDAPMTSFWIPKLGGQVYAMSGMSTQLHLQAHTAGEYTGRNANISGEGYAGMTFTVRAGSEEEFGAWVTDAVGSSKELSTESYKELAKPSQNVAPEQFRLRTQDLYDTVIMKYMMPEETHGNTSEHYHE